MFALWRLGQGRPQLVEHLVELRQVAFHLAAHGRVVDAGQPGLHRATVVSGQLVEVGFYLAGDGFGLLLAVCGPQGAAHAAGQQQRGSSRYGAQPAPQEQAPSACVAAVHARFDALPEVWRGLGQVELLAVGDHVFFQFVGLHGRRILAVQSGRNNSFSFFFARWYWLFEVASLMPRISAISRWS